MLAVISGQTGEMQQPKRGEVRGRCVLWCTYPLPRHIFPHSERKPPECGDSLSLQGWAATPPELRGKQRELSADDMQVRGQGEDTKMEGTVINRLTSAASLGAAKDVAVIPNLTEKKNTQK